MNKPMSIEKQQLHRTAYFRNPRTEMLKYVPSGVTRILEVGCGSGVFGAALRERQRLAGEARAHMIGLELEPAAADLARGTFDQVIAGYFFDQVPTLQSGTFDCVVGNDVVEHLTDPWRALAQLHRLLCPGGRLVLSLPNIRFWGVVKDLVWNGGWKYADDGVLDRTHLRFFTRSSIESLLRDSAFEDVSVEGINSQLSGWKVDSVNLVTGGRFNDMRYLQFAACASRPLGADR